MAPRGSKRNSGAAARGAAAKKPKADPRVAGVLEALAACEGLPDSCRAMLEAGMPLSLGAPADERTSCQKVMVEMIGEAVASSRAQFQAAADAEAARVRELDGARGGLEERVAAAEAALAAAEEVARERTAALGQASTAACAEKMELGEREAAQRQGGEEHEAARSALEEVEKALVQHFRPLTEAGDESGEAYYASLLPLLKGAGMDESLMSALPSTCAKKTSDRTSFDTMAIEQLGKHLNEKAAALRGAVERGAPAAKERAAAVQAAKEKLEAAKMLQLKSAEDLSAARQAERDAAEALAAAKAELEGSGPALAAARATLAEKTDALENFVAYNVACFDVLRDAKSARAPEAAPAA